MKSFFAKGIAVRTTILVCLVHMHTRRKGSLTQQRSKLFKTVHWNQRVNLLNLNFKIRIGEIEEEIFSRKERKERR